MHLDTHVAAWLHAEELDRIPGALRHRMEVERLAISPMVILELSLLHEIGRLRDTAEVVLRTLTLADIQVDRTPFAAVVDAAMPLVFTRDPFDRLIAAQARAAGAALVTRDRDLLAALPEAVWA